MGRHRLGAVGASVFLAATILTLLSPVDATAQTRSLTWTEATRLEVPGPLGLILQATGAATPSQSRNAVHLQGRVLVQETGSTTTVMDLDNRHWMLVDHDNGVYSTVTFEEMAQLTREALQGAYASAEGSSGADAREEFERTMEETQANIEFRVSSESSGQRQQIGSHNALQHFITTEFEATAVPEGVDEPEGGSMAFLAELWVTNDVPTGEELYEEWARQLASDPAFRQIADELASSGEDVSEKMAQNLSTWNPQIGAGMLRMAEAIEALEGAPIRTTVTAALVPIGARFDRQELVAWEPQSMGDQLRSQAGSAAREAAGEAARAAIGGLLGGRFGGRGSEPEPVVAEAQPAVRPLFRVVTTREDIAYRESSDDILGELKARIASYEQQDISTEQ